MSDLLIDSATKWVVDNYAYNRDHLLQSLVWMDRIAPGSRLAARLAVLTHDMERAFPGPDQPIAIDLNDFEYNRAHSERSARIVGEWLSGQTGDRELLHDVVAMVRVHEFGGWPEANLVQAADSLSLLEVNVELFLNMVRSGKRPIQQIKVKFARSYERIQVPHARELALPLLERANTKLAGLELELSSVAP